MVLLNKLLRWIFVLLLLLNAGYYGSHNYFYQPLKSSHNVLNAPTIKLLSEVSEPLIEINSKPQAQDNNCWFLGGVSDQNQAKNLEQRLLSFDIATKVVQKDGAKQGVDYLVYLAPNPSLQVAEQQIAELKIKQLEGYIITYGDLNNAVALGIFPDRNTAEEQLKLLRDAGYIPRLREQMRTNNSFLLQIAPQSIRLLDNNVLNKLTEDFPYLTPTIMPCE